MYFDVIAMLGLKKKMYIMIGIYFKNEKRLLLRRSKFENTIH